MPARRPRSTLDQPRLSRSFADAPARALWNTWTRTGLDLQLNVIRLQADEKLHCKVPAGLTEVIPLQKRQLAAKAMHEIIRSGRVAAGQLHGVLRFHDPENALKGKKYLAEFHLAAAPSGPEAVQYEMRSLTVKDFSGQVVLHADLDAPASARHQATTSGADRAELSAAPLSETEHKAYTEHMQTQKRALLNGAQSPAVIVSCLAAMNAKGLAGGTTCMLYEGAAALRQYLRDFPKHPDYVVAVLGDVDPLLEDAARVHFTAGIVHRDAGAYSMAFVDPGGKIENLQGLSAAEHVGAKAAIQAWLHVQNDGENCAHFSMRFAEHAAQEDVRAEIVGKLDALADGNAPKGAHIERTGQTWTCALTGAEESSFFFPIQFFKEIQWSTVLGELLAAHRLEDDRWDEIAVSTKSLDGKAGMTIEEHYHYNKERLGVGHSQAIMLKAKKDRKAALEFIQALEKMPDGGAAAWKAALVQLSPWLTPGGDVTDSIVGIKLANKPIELHKPHDEDDDQYLSSSDESLAELARQPPPVLERSTGRALTATSTT